MAPKYKSSGTGNLDTPERSYKVLPACKKVKILDLIRKEKMYAELVQNYGNNESSIHKNCKEEKINFC